MAVTYTTVDSVGNYLGFPDGYFTLTSTPSISIVEKFINRAEDRIDTATGHAWREKTITKEYPRPASVYRYGTGISFKLIHRTIRSITSLEVWNGSEWEEWIGNKTEGRNNDYWIDETDGIVYLISSVRIYHKGVRISYTYGEDTVSGGIEEATTMMAATMILNAPEFSAVLFTQAGEQRPDYTALKETWKQEINSILANNTEFQ